MAPNVISQALSNMAASKTSIISTAASLAASAVLLRTIANDLLPRDVRRHLSSALAGLLHRLSSEFTVVIEEYEGIAINQLYSCAEVYLGSISSPSTRRVRASKSEKERSITIAAEQGQKTFDVFDGIRLKWVLVHRETINRTMYNSHGDYGSSTIRTQIRYFRLVFDKSHKNKVFSAYLPYMMEKAKAMKDAKKGLKLHMLKQEHHYYPGRGETWTSVNFDHPATFETLAMEPDVKRSLIDDLGRFVAGKEHYRKVGKAWKRGYLLYGPPGTGKSSLIAAIANHLSYNVYDLELADLRSNSELRKLLLSTSNRSILVVEDIDRTIDLTNQRAEEEQAAATSGRRSAGRKPNQDYRVTLSGLLNFIDGLWSSCGDERIVIFTTNHREKLDPALLRPGRMDVHIHMSYCTPSGFRTLAKNYLDVNDHHLFEEIDGLIQEVQVTPAEVAEELMKNSDPNAALQMLIQFLQEKKKMISTEHIN